MKVIWYVWFHFPGLRASPSKPNLCWSRFLCLAVNFQSALKLCSNFFFFYRESGHSWLKWSYLSRNPQGRTGHTWVGMLELKLESDGQQIWGRTWCCKNPSEVGKRKECRLTVTNTVTGIRAQRPVSFLWISTLCINVYIHVWQP